MARDNECGGDTPTEEIYLYHDWERDDSVSEAILEGVAAVTDTPKANLDLPLYEIVEPDALDKLCQPLNDDGLRDGSGHVKFSLQGCTVTLDWSGRIKIEPPEES